MWKSIKEAVTLKDIRQKVESLTKGVSLAQMGFLFSCDRMDDMERQLDVLEGHVAKLALRNIELKKQVKALEEKNSSRTGMPTATTAMAGANPTKKKLGRPVGSKNKTKTHENRTSKRTK